MVFYLNNYEENRPKSIPMRRVGNSTTLWETQEVQVPRNWSGFLVMNGKHRSVIDAFNEKMTQWPAGIPAAYLCPFHPLREGRQTQVLEKLAMEGLFSYSKSILWRCNADTLNTLISAMIPLDDCSSSSLQHQDVRIWVETNVQQATPEQRLFLCMAWLCMAYRDKNGTLWPGIRLKAWCRRLLVQSIAPVLTRLPGLVTKTLAWLLDGDGLQQPWLIHLDHWSLLYHSHAQTVLHRSPDIDAIRDWLKFPCSLEPDTVRDLASSINLKELARTCQNHLLLFLRLCQKLFATAKEGVRKAMEEFKAMNSFRCDQDLPAALGLGECATEQASANEECIIDLWRAASEQELHQLLLTAASLAPHSDLFAELLDHHNDYLSANPSKVQRKALQWIMGGPGLIERLFKLSRIQETRTLKSSGQLQDTVARDVRTELDKEASESPPRLLERACVVASMSDKSQVLFGHLVTNALQKVQLNEQMSMQCFEALQKSYTRYGGQAFLDK